MTIIGRPKLAIIPLAGRATRLRPASLAVPKGLFPLIDVDGRAKATVHLILQEAFDSGIERVCLVTGPGGDVPFRRYLDAAHETGEASWAGSVEFAVQPVPEGFGHAIYCARDVAAGEPVLVMLGDTIYQSHEAMRCAAQVLDSCANRRANVSGVMRILEAQIGAYGTVLGAPVDARTWRMERLIEKPDADTARASLRTPGLPDGTYIGRFGIDAVSAGIFEVLAEDVAAGRRERGEFQFAGAQARLAEREPYYVYEVSGRPLDMGNPEEYLATQRVLTEIRQSLSLS